MALTYSVTAGLDVRLDSTSCCFTSERRGLSSHPALICFVQHLLCLRVVSRLSSATDSDKLTKALEAKKKIIGNSQPLPHLGKGLLCNVMK